MGMIHITDPSEENKEDKLRKLRPLLDMMKGTCQLLFQPGRNMAVDERMVKSKARVEIRQFMANKPVRFGYKLWCMCDSATGYTVDFE